jgi:ATP-dependent Clp protease ATP-binding subunit ClpC
VRRRVEAAFGPGALEGTAVGGRAPGGGAVPFTPAAKRALELALRAALELGHRSIGPAHVLLGIVRVGDGGLARVLDRHGLAPDDVCGAVLDELAHAA